MDPVSIVISRQATGPTPPTAANAVAPNALRTRVSEVVAQMGPPPWSKRIIADERQLVTLIASAPGGGNRPHWHREFDEWWVVLAGQRARPHDEPRALGRQAGRAHRVLHAALPKDLHRARIDPARLGMNGGGRMPLDQQRRHPEP